MFLQQSTIKNTETNVINDTVKNAHTEDIAYSKCNTYPHAFLLCCYLVVDKQLFGALLSPETAGEPHIQAKTATTKFLAVLHIGPTQI